MAEGVARQSMYNKFVKKERAAATEHSESSSIAIDALPALEAQAAAPLLEEEIFPLYVYCPRRMLEEAPAATRQSTATEHGLPESALSRTISFMRNRSFLFAFRRIGLAR